MAALPRRFAGLSVRQFLWRVSFGVAALLIVPLAVLNRQQVPLKLNPFDFFTPEQSFTITLPLIVLLGVAFITGAAVGWVVGQWPFGKRQKSTSPKKIELSDVPIVVKTDATEVENLGTDSASQNVPQLKDERHDT